MSVDHKEPWPPIRLPSGTLLTPQDRDPQSPGKSLESSMCHTEDDQCVALSRVIHLAASATFLEYLTWWNFLIGGPATSFLPRHSLGRSRQQKLE